MWYCCVPLPYYITCMHQQEKTPGNTYFFFATNNINMNQHMWVWIKMGPNNGLRHLSIFCCSKMFNIHMQIHHLLLYLLISECSCLNFHRKVVAIGTLASIVQITYQSLGFNLEPVSWYYCDLAYQQKWMSSMKVAVLVNQHSWRWWFANRWHWELFSKRVTYPLVI